MVKRCRELAFKRGFAFDLTVEHLQDLWKRQMGRCYWFGIPMTFIGAHAPAKLSVDRLDCTRGYVEGNVVLACQAANLGRNRATAEEFATFCGALRRTWSTEYVA